ncbi:MAG: hypothetical protein J1E36_00920 [Eubacterium sp.]|nr:hypothetical protein [Eubacterium sp.]
MQKTRARLPVLLIIITVIASCVLRFFQLFGKISFNGNTDSYILYLLIFLCFVFAVIYSVFKKDLAETFDISNGKKSIFLSSALLSLSFFYDFIHQGYNCYSYVSSVFYIDYVYLIPMGVSGVFALISCFYFLTLALTERNENYDFKNFTFLHFAPVVWAFSKLIGIMSQIIDVKNNVELFSEFILICITLCFLFSMISAVDKKNAGATRAFVFFSLMLTAMAFIVALPRIVLIMMDFSTFSEVTFSSVTYLMSGVFSLTILCDINKRTKLK